MDYIEKNRLREEYIKLFRKNNSKYFLTVTFKQDISYNQTVLTGKSLIRRLRKEYFGRNRVRDFLKGYVVIEKQGSGRPHLHFLISDHAVFNRTDKPFHKTVIKKCRNLKLIDEKMGVDIQDYYQCNLEEYLTKSFEFHKNDFDFIMPLTYDGF